MFVASRLILKILHDAAVGGKTVGILALFFKKKDPRILWRRQADTLDTRVPLGFHCGRILYILIQTSKAEKIKKKKKHQKIFQDFLATAQILLVIRVYLSNHYFCQYSTVVIFPFSLSFPSGQLSIMGMHNIQVYFTIALDV